MTNLTSTGTLDATAISGVLSATGGANAQTIKGGTGADVITGNAGTDTFIYTPIADVTTLNVNDFTLVACIGSDSTAGAASRRRPAPLCGVRGSATMALR